MVETPLSRIRDGASDYSIESSTHATHATHRFHPDPSLPSFRVGCVGGVAIFALVRDFYYPVRTTTGRLAKFHVNFSGTQVRREATQGSAERVGRWWPTAWTSLELYLEVQILQKRRHCSFKVALEVEHFAQRWHYG